MWPDKGLLAEKLLADRAYTANKLFALAERQSHEVAIPPVKGILLQREYATHAYKERHLVECFFAKIKSFRRAATRYDKLSLCCLENARDILLALETEFRSLYARNLTLSRLGEAVILPLCPDKGGCMTYDLSRAASTYLEGDIELLKRMRPAR